MIRRLFCNRRAWNQRYFTAMLVILTLVGWSAVSNPGQQPIPINPIVRDIELKMVKFDKPVRVGYGKEARFYTEALEILLTVDPYLERDIEPFLYIGKVEIRGHETMRHKKALTLIFSVFEQEKLSEGACINLTIDHGAPIRNSELHRDCPFRFSRKNIHWHSSSSPRPTDFAELKAQLYDPRGRPIREIEPGDSLSIGLSGLLRGVPIQIYVLDDQNREWSYARLFADQKGTIEHTLLWYNTGVIGTTTRKIDWKPEPSFETFEEATRYFAMHPVRLEFRNLKGELIQVAPLQLAEQRNTPLLYPSNSKGVLMNAIEAQREDVYVTGTKFPPGAKILLFAVRNQYVWNTGNPFTDLTGPDLTQEIETVELAPDETAFTKKIWDRRLTRPGAYDLVARVVREFPRDLRNLRFRLQDTDILSFGEDTAVLLYAIINGNIVIESAGRMRGSPAYFEFSDSFERHESVFGAVDPSDVPAVHSGGNYAAYYVVEHKPQSYWDGSSPVLTDASGGVEIKRVKYWCINVSREKIWPDPDPTTVVKEYDVVVSFGAVPAMTAADFVQDNTYHKGTDFIDGYSKVGFYVLDDPATPGPFAVGSGNYYDDTFNAPADPNDPFNFSTIGFPLVRNWFTIRYPAASAGPGAPLPPGTAKYPVALFLHGRHWICSVGVSGYDPEHYSTTCATGSKIPSHQGYNYILDVLATHGIIAVSIDAFDIQPSNGPYNYEARGRLILEHLNRLKAWNINGTDPFGGIFQNRIDMTKIAIVGHSRGGEGVVAATEINVTEAATYGLSIVAVVAIAPTDQQSGTKWDIETAPYFLLAGAADGDVTNQQGFRTYDRAYPTGAVTQHNKAVVWIHGANHNYFNTIWTPSPPLPTPNPYDGAVNDGATWTGPKITDVEQRQIALSTIVGLLQQHLQGIQPYREIFTGRLQLASLRIDMMHWGYQDPVRLTVDDYQQGMPGSITTNSLGGSVSLTPGFATSAETSFGAGGSPSDPCFYHQTWGVKLGWNSLQSYESTLPAAQQDVSMYTHLSFRITQVPDGGTLNPVGSPKNLRVNLQDADGDKALWDLDTDDFTPIPYPYQRSAVDAQCQMKMVRIPLQNFTMNNSGVDLNKIQKVVIRFPGTGLVGIDDIQFSK